MRILHVIPTFAPAWRYGGPMYAVEGLAQAQAQLGHAVTVFTTNADGPFELEVPTNVPVERDAIRVWYFEIGCPRRIGRSPALGRALNSLADYDIMHIHSIFNWPTNAAARAARKTGIPYFLSPRGMLAPATVERRGEIRKQLWLNLLEKRNLAGACGVFATADMEKREVEQGEWTPAPVEVVPNGITLDDIDQAVKGTLQNQEALPKEYILYLGRLSWKKGIDRLIEALAGIPGVSLLIAGGDDEGLTPELTRLADRLGVGGRVRFMGPVQGLGKWHLYAGARAFVLPSLAENFANTVLEAMACRCPVVVSPQVGLASVVERAGAGVVAETEAASLSRAINRLLSDREGADGMGRRGREVVEREFLWPGIARRTVDIYETSISGFRRGRVVH